MKDYQKQIVETVAKKNDIPEHKVKACLNHVCTFIKHTIMHLDYDQIRWPKLGTFTRMEPNKNINRTNEESTTSSKTTQRPEGDD